MALRFLALALSAAALVGACSGGTPQPPQPQAAAVSPTDLLIARYQARLRAAPDDPSSLAALAGAYLQKVREVGDPSYYPRADGLLHRALAARPDDAEALIEMGALDLARHRFRDALDWGARAVHADPDSARALGVVGDAQVELGRYAEAFATFQHMVDRSEEHTSELQSLRHLVCRLLLE